MHVLHDALKTDMTQQPISATLLRGAVMTAAARSSLYMSQATDSTVRLSDGTYFNEQFEARNLWEIPVDPEIIDEAARIFYSQPSFLAVTAMREPYEAIETQVEGLSFFAQAVTWESNIAWCAHWPPLATVGPVLHIPGRLQST